MDDTTQIMSCSPSTRNESTAYLLKQMQVVDLHGQPLPYDDRDAIANGQHDGLEFRPEDAYIPGMPRWLVQANQARQQHQLPALQQYTLPAPHQPHLQPPHQSQQINSLQHPTQPQQHTTGPARVLFSPTTRYEVVEAVLGGSDGRPVDGGMNMGIALVREQLTQRIFLEKRVSMHGASRQKRARAEIRAVTLLEDAGGSPYINRFLETAWNGNPRNPCSLIFEFCDGGSLADLIDRYHREEKFNPEDFVWHTMLSLSAALSFLHFGLRDLTRIESAPHDWDTMAHLDLKPNSVCMDEG